MDPLTGKELRRKRSGFKTKKEAEITLARIKVEIDKGTFRKARAETYNDLYDLWVKHYKNTVEEGTFVKTVGIFRNHILPELGVYKIDKMNVDTCQKCVDTWATKLKNFSMVKAYAAKVLDFAIKRGTWLPPYTLLTFARSRSQHQRSIRSPGSFRYTNNYEYLRTCF